MPRLLFEKTGNAIWISHLDLMRLFQRAFKRAGLPLTHTHGFNPRPSVSIALPLSVGTESCCELLDFPLESDAASCEEIRDRLNSALIPGVRVLDVYDDGRKLRDLSLMDCKIVLEYDRGVPKEAADALRSLFSADSIIVPKKTKNGPVDQDIAPMIRCFDVCTSGETVIEFNTRICCQNPALNPVQIVAAIQNHMPQYASDFSRCTRIELYDSEGKIFR